MLPRRHLLVASLLLPFAAVWAQVGSALQELGLSRGEEDLRLSYTARLELPKPIEDALLRGIPLYFVAEAQVTRVRWYWRDATLARGSRQWRLTYQPLTRQYRLSTGGLQQSYDSLTEALASVARVSGWALELREELQAGAAYELAFRLRLDTTQLPGPMQIGLGPGAVLDLNVARKVLPTELAGSLPPAKE